MKTYNYYIDERHETNRISANVLCTCINKRQKGNKAKVKVQLGHQKITIKRTYGNWEWDCN